MSKTKAQLYTLREREREQSKGEEETVEQRGRERSVCDCVWRVGGLYTCVCGSSNAAAVEQRPQVAT